MEIKRKTVQFKENGQAWKSIQLCLNNSNNNGNGKKTIEDIISEFLPKNKTQLIEIKRRLFFEDISQYIPDNPETHQLLNLISALFEDGLVSNIKLNIEDLEELIEKYT